MYLPGRILRRYKTPDINDLDHLYSTRKLVTSQVNYFIAAPITAWVICHGKTVVRQDVGVMAKHDGYSLLILIIAAAITADNMSPIKQLFVRMPEIWPSKINGRRCPRKAVTDSRSPTSLCTGVILCRRVIVSRLGHAIFYCLTECESLFRIFSRIRTPLHRNKPRQIFNINVHSKCMKT